MIDVTDLCKTSLIIIIIIIIIIIMINQFVTRQMPVSQILRRGN